MTTQERSFTTPGLLWGDNTCPPLTGKFKDPDVILLILGQMRKCCSCEVELALVHHSCKKSKLHACCCFSSFSDQQT